jgi:hypothetical protein
MIPLSTMPSISPVSMKSDIWCLNLRWVSPVFRLGGVKYVLDYEPGYTTDGASIPRFFWRLFGHPLQMPLLIAALPHDGLYSGELCTRAEADAAFLAIMKKIGIGLVKRNAIYAAVRSGGWTVWNRHTVKSIAKSRAKCVLVRADKMEEGAA